VGVVRLDLVGQALGALEQMGFKPTKARALVDDALRADAHSDVATLLACRPARDVVTGRTRRGRGTVALVLQPRILATLPFERAPAGALVLPPSLSRVDRAILDAALGDWRGGTFADAAARLRRATEDAIPAGRVYLLAQTALGPVIGSLVSGVGIAAGAHGLLVVRVVPAGVADAMHTAPAAAVGWR